MAGADPKRTSLPELVGNPATPTVIRINHDRPELAVEVLPPGSPIIPDFNPARVPVLIDNNGLVAKRSPSLSS